MVILKALFTIQSNKIEAAYHSQLYGVTLDATNKFSATLPVEILFQSKETPYKETDKYIVKVLDATERQFAVEYKTLSNFQYTLSVDDLTIEELETMLNAGLALKANLTHTHAIADVVNLQTTLDGKATSSHTHTIAQITGLEARLAAAEAKVAALETAG